MWKIIIKMHKFSDINEALRKQYFFSESDDNAIIYVNTPYMFKLEN
jgi:hypothetical protein